MSPQLTLFAPPRSRRAILPDRYLNVHTWWPLRSLAVREFLTAECFELGDRTIAALTTENPNAVPVGVV